MAWPFSRRRQRRRRPDLDGCAGRCAGQSVLRSDRSDGLRQHRRANGGVLGALVLSNSDGSDIVTTQAITLGVAGGGTGAAAGAGTGLGTTLAVGGTGSTLTGKVTLTDSKPVTITDVGARRRCGSAGIHQRSCHRSQPDGERRDGDPGQPERTDGCRCQQHHLLDRCGPVDSVGFPEPIGRHPESLHGGGR